MNNVELKVGQSWEFNCENIVFKYAYVVIRKIEINISHKHIIHLSIINLNINNNYKEISHLPIDLDFFIESILDKMSLRKELENLDKESYFIEGYQYWEKAKGGVWNLPLKEAITKTVMVQNGSVVN